MTKLRYDSWKTIYLLDIKVLNKVVGAGLRLKVRIRFPWRDIFLHDLYIYNYIMDY